MEYDMLPAINLPFPERLIRMKQKQTMKTVYKYPLEIADSQTIEMPSGAQILTVQTQSEKPFIWAVVDTERPMQGRFIEMVGTGHPLTGQDSRQYIGTFQLHSGRLVFHVFEYTGV